MRRWNGAVLLLPAIVYLATPAAGVAGIFLAETMCLIGLLIVSVRSQNALLRTRVPAGVLPLLLLAIFTVLQLVPLPAFLVDLLSPLTAEWYGRSIWLMDPEAAMPLSIRPKSTLIAFFHLASGGALFIFAASVLADRERAKNLAFVLCGVTALAALMSVIVLLVRPWNHLQVFIPFGLFATILPFAAGLYLAERPETPFGTLRERVVEAVLRPASRPDIVAGIAVLIPCVALIFVPTPWFLCGGAGLGIFALLLLLKPGKRIDAVPLAAVAIFVAVGGLAVNGLESAYAPPWEFPSFPTVFGAGFGAGDLLPGTETAAPSGAMKFFVEGGALAAVLAGIFLLALYGRTVVSWRHRKRRFSVYVGGSALAAATVPLFAATVFQFSSDNGVFLLFFLLAGLASALSRHSADNVGLGTTSRPVHRGVAVTAAAVLAGNLLFRIGVFSAAALPSDGAGAATAVRFDPLEEGYRLALGHTALSQGKEDESLAFFRTAARLSPLTGESLQGVALSYKAGGRDEESGRFLEASLGLGSGMSEGYRLYVDWLLASRRLSDGTATIQHALERYPDDTIFYLERLEKYGMSLPEMKSVLPRRFAVFTVYGHYLDHRGLGENAADSFRAALACYGKERPNPNALAQVASWFARTGRIEDALATVREGLRRSPGDPGLRRIAADCYERIGLTVKADEERRALKLMRGK